MRTTWLSAGNQFTYLFFGGFYKIFRCTPGTVPWDCRTRRKRLIERWYQTTNYFVGEQAEFHALRSWDVKIGEGRIFIQTLAWSFCRSCVPSDVGPGIWTNGKFLTQAPHNFANPVELVQCRVSKS